MEHLSKACLLAHRGCLPPVLTDGAGSCVDAGPIHKDSSPGGPAFSYHHPPGRHLGGWAFNIGVLGEGPGSHPLQMTTDSTCSCTEFLLLQIVATQVFKDRAGGFSWASKKNVPVCDLVPVLSLPSSHHHQTQSVRPISASVHTTWNLLSSLTSYI
jgi:hypothetical protein